MWCCNMTTPIVDVPALYVNINLHINENKRVIYLQWAYIMKNMEYFLFHFMPIGHFKVLHSGPLKNHEFIRTLWRVSTRELRRCLTAETCRWWFQRDCESDQEEEEVLKRRPRTRKRSSTSWEQQPASSVSVSGVPVAKQWLCAFLTRTHT